MVHAMSVNQPDVTKQLEALAQRHADKTELVTCSRYFADPLLKLAWFSYGEHTLETLGNAGTRLLARLVNNLPHPLSYGVLTNIPPLLRQASTGLSERILEASTRLLPLQTITLLEQIPRMITLPRMSATVFDQWFANTKVLEDTRTLDSYIGLDALSYEVLTYYTQGGTISCVMNVLKPYTTDARSVLRAIHAFEQENPRDITSFLHYVQTDGVDDVRHKRIFGDDPVLAEVLQDYFVAGKALGENFIRRQTVRVLEQIGMTRRTITQLREEMRSSSGVSLENTVDVHYGIFIAALDRWMEAEHALYALNAKARSERETHQQNVKRVVNTRAVLRQLSTLPEVDVVAEACIRQLGEIAHKYLGQDHALTNEVQAYTEVALERAYFHALVARVEQSLTEKTIMTNKEHDAAVKALTQQREELNRSQDWWKSVFVTYAQPFKNKHPVFYDTKGQRFVILPEEMQSYAQDCTTEVRAGQMYFTRPAWKVQHA